MDNYNVLTPDIIDGRYAQIQITPELLDGRDYLYISVLMTPTQNKSNLYKNIIKSLKVGNRAKEYNLIVPEKSVKIIDHGSNTYLEIEINTKDLVSYSDGYFKIFFSRNLVLRNVSPILSVDFIFM